MTKRPDPVAADVPRSKRTIARRARERMLTVTAEYLADLEGQIAAINQTQAVIQFALDGTILRANDNFLRAVGYTLEEIRGKHHSVLVEPAYRDSDDYRRFWERLGRGESDSNRYKRIGKGGREVWVQASYHPLLDCKGRPYKVVKFAVDVTALVLSGSESL